jgi:NADP-dependent 3-hydroxy acid dehydrogenase YdfG
MEPTAPAANPRVAVVTGASSGIGAATAAALAAAGFDVRAGARRVDRLAELAGRTGGALGLEPVAEANDDFWRRMYETNVLGTMRLTRALLPRLLASGDGHVVNVGSIAGFETYPGGGGYTAAKHAERALTRTLRLELLGQPIRITEIAPGLVETEFSLVRFAGDAERAAGVYRGLDPLTAADVADCILWAATRPSHVNIDEIVVRPRDQASAVAVHRRPS